MNCWIVLRYENVWYKYEIVYLNSSKIESFFNVRPCLKWWTGSRSSLTWPSWTTSSRSGPTGASSRMRRYKKKSIYEYFFFWFIFISESYLSLILWGISRFLCNSKTSKIIINDYYRARPPFWVSGGLHQEDFLFGSNIFSSTFYRRGELFICHNFSYCFGSVYNSGWFPKP